MLIVAYELSYTYYTVSPPPGIISNAEFLILFQRPGNIMKMAGYEPKGIRDNGKEIMTDLKRLMSRASITEREAHMLHGIISQLEDSLRKDLMFVKLIIVLHSNFPRSLSISF